MLLEHREASDFSSGWWGRLHIGNKLWKLEKGLKRSHDDSTTESSNAGLGVVGFAGQVIRDKTEKTRLWARLATMTVS